MDGFLQIILLAVIAGILIWRLRAVLGRRPDDEHQRAPRFSHRNTANHNAPATKPHLKQDGNVVSLPGARLPGDEARSELKTADLSKYLPEGSPLMEELEKLHQADQYFDPATFVMGARKAYEMVVTAFAAGDRKTLKSLLTEDVYNRFDAAIADREAQQNMVESEFIGVDKTEFVNVTLKDKIARVTVKFISNMVSVTKNAQGHIIEGDPTKIKRVTDVWTFVRDITNPDPNWRLAGTSASSHS